MHSPACPRRVAILNDSAADVRLLSLILAQHMPHTELVSALGAAQAWQFVRGEGAFAGAPPVSLVFVDKWIGGEDGLELVRHIRTQGTTPHVPIVVFSAANHPEDVEESYRAGANAFVPKPNTLDEHERILEAVADFWCTAAALPA